MDKSELKRAIARSTNTGFNQTAYSELAAASQEELNSMIGKEAQQERSRRELFIEAPNNWEMAIKAFNNGVPVRLLFPEIKNHKPREVSITPKLADVIMIWLNKRKEFKVSLEAFEKLHISTELKPINMRNLQKYFLEYCRLAKVDKDGVRCSPYTLKHTFCKLFLLGGGSVNALREIVGHIDQRSIYKYTRANSKEASENHLSYAPSLVYDF
jgi:integrase